jgi:predicted DNA-binding transcriptional regulator YafY
VILYESGSWGCSKRRVTPRAMLQHAGRAYLTAFCHHAQIEKTYRLDRRLAVRTAK